MHILDAGMTLPRQIFGRCPACLANFIDFWCTQGCATNEHEFMVPNAGGRRHADGSVVVRSTPLYLPTRTMLLQVYNTPPASDDFLRRRRRRSTAEVFIRDSRLFTTCCVHAYELRAK